MSISNLLTAPSKSWLKQNANTLKLDGVDGFLKLNNMTTTQSAALVQVPGMLVYDTTLAQVVSSNGTAFAPIARGITSQVGTLAWEVAASQIGLNQKFGLQVIGNIATLSTSCTNNVGVVAATTLLTVSVPVIIPSGFRPALATTFVLAFTNSATNLTTYPVLTVSTNGVLSLVTTATVAGGVYSILPFSASWSIV